MRTTVGIAAELLAAARRRARAQGRTVGQVVEGALRRELARPAAALDGPPVPAFRGGSGPRPGLDLSSNRVLHEVLDEDVPSDRLR